MPWTSELPEKSEDITWLELDQKGNFVLEQKLKDVSTPRGGGGGGGGRSRSNTVVPTRATGSFGSRRSPHIFIECLRYGFTPSSLPEFMVQFRIRTRESVARCGSPIVIATECGHEAIMSHWVVVTTQFLPLCSRAGLDAGLHTIKYSPQRWLDFLLFLVSIAAKQKLPGATQLDVKDRARTRDLSSSLEDVRNHKRGRHHTALSHSQGGMTINQMRRKPSLAQLPRLPSSLESFGEREELIDRKHLLQLLSSPVRLPLLFDLTETVIQSQNCVLVCWDTNGIRRQWHSGVLLLTSAHLCFCWCEKESETHRLNLKLSDLEKVQLGSDEEALPAPEDSISVLHHNRKQYLFAGIPPTSDIAIKVLRVWADHLEQQLKALRHRLWQQTTVYTTTDTIGPKILASLIQRATGNRRRERAVVPTTTKMPLFSLAPFVQATADSQKCLLSIPSHVDLPVSGRFYLTMEGATFVSLKQSLMMNLPFEKCQLIQLRCAATDPEATSGEVEVMFGDLAQPIVVSRLTQRLQSRWEANWKAAVSHNATLNRNFYSQFPDEHDSPELVFLKQHFLSTKLVDSGESYRLYWKEYYRSHGGASLRTDTLQRLIYIGIPNSLRGRWWGRLAGIAEKKKALDEVPYGYMLSEFGGQESIATLEISRDVGRSLPEHDYYSKGDGCEVLESILCAYSWRNSSIGYCQSMNLISALLLVYMSEEDTYLMLSIICGKSLPCCCFLSCAHCTC